MNKKLAFTTAELLISMSVLGFLALLLVTSISNKSFNEKADIAIVNRIVASLQQATTRIFEMETTKCPEHAFMVQITDDGVWDMALVGVDTNAKLADLYSPYIKHKGSTLNFCQNTVDQDSVTDCTSDSVYIPGFELHSGAFLGFKLLATSSIGTCADHYVFDGEEKTLVSSNEICFAYIYIDTNGKKEPNKYGQDIFKFGIAPNGIAY